MAEIKWEAIKAPDTGDYLKYLAYAQSQQQDAIKGLMETAKGVQTSIRDKNNAQLLDLLNQQKSTNDLSGDTFQQAWQQHVNNFSGEYDANKAAEAQRAMFDTLQNRQAKAQDMDIQNQTNIRAADKFNMDRDDHTRVLNAQRIFDITSIPPEQRTPEQVAMLNNASSNYDAKELLGLHTGNATLGQIRATTDGKLKENKWIDLQAQAGINQSNASAAASFTNADYNKAQTDAQRNENKITGYSINQLESNNPQLNNPKYTEKTNKISKALGTANDWFVKNTGQDLNTQVTAFASKYNVPEVLAKAIIPQESGGNVAIRSPAGAFGLMQLMPATAERMGVDINNPVQNLEGGIKYLGYLYKRFNGDIDKTLAAYNAGEGNVDKYGGIPPFRETKDYVKKVKENINIIESGKTGQSIDWGKGVYVNGKMVGEPKAPSGGSAAIEAAFKQSPAGIKSGLLTDLGKIDQEVLAANANTGGGTYKNPTAFLKENSGIMADNLYDAALGKNLKFDNPELKKQYSSINVGGFKLLNDAQQAGVLERVYKRLGDRHFYGNLALGVTDQDAVDMRKFVADEVNLLLKPKAQQITNKRDARIIEAVSEYTARHGVTGYDAAKDLGVDEKTMKRIGIEIPKASAPQDIASPSASQQFTAASNNLQTSARAAIYKKMQEAREANKTVVINNSFLSNTKNTQHNKSTSPKPLIFNNQTQRRPTLNESMKMFGF